MNSQDVVPSESIVPKERNLPPLPSPSSVPGGDGTSAIGNTETMLFRLKFHKFHCYYYYKYPFPSKDCYSCFML